MRFLLIIILSILNIILFAQNKDYEEFMSTGEITSISLSSDGLIIACGSFDRSIILWNTKTGKIKKRLRGHTSIVTSVAFSPNGKKIISASANGEVIIWEPRRDKFYKSNKIFFKHKQHIGAVINTVVFSEDGRYAASGDNNGLICIIDTKSFKVSIIKENLRIISLEFAKDTNNYFLFTHSDFEINKWDIINKTLVSNYVSKFHINKFQTNLIGNELIYGTDKGEFFCLDLKQLSLIRKFDLDINISTFFYLWDAKKTIICDAYGIIRVFDKYNDFITIDTLELSDMIWNKINCVSEKNKFYVSYNNVIQHYEIKTDLAPKIYVLSIGISEYDRISPIIARNPRSMENPHVASSEFLNYYKSIFYKIDKKKYQFENLTNTDATYENVYSRISQMSKSFSINDLFIFYYIGHGWYDEESKKSYICPYDYNPDNGNIGISDSDIVGIINNSDINHAVFFIEACRSRSLPTTEIFEPDSNIITMRMKTNPLGSDENIEEDFFFNKINESDKKIVFYYSCSPNEITQSGSFISSILKGFFALSKIDKDGIIYDTDLFNYIENNNEYYNQNPTFKIIKGDEKTKIPLFILKDMQ